ncbi:MAG TPA: hypothetical protein VHQ47_07245 [Phycisphaerae bacterium]|nr:hypothetical protein [Phycisphaerae bacterium]
MEFPASLRLWLPRDYMGYCQGDPVSVSEANYPKGLRIGWDDNYLTFAAANGSAVYARWAVSRFVYRQADVLAGIRFCSLRIEIKDRLAKSQHEGDSLIVLSSSLEDASLFDNVVKGLAPLEALVPIKRIGD